MVLYAATGLHLRLSLSQRKLDVVFALPNSLQNGTRGLLGVFNNDPSDDLTRPDGTRLSSDASVRDIYYKFGELCKRLRFDN